MIDYIHPQETKGSFKIYKHITLLKMNNTSTVGQMITVDNNWSLLLNHLFNKPKLTSCKGAEIQIY